MDFTEYNGKRVIVTGCSSGIGGATAKALIGLGAEVHGVSRRRPDLDLAAFDSVDLGDPEAIRAAFADRDEHVDAVFNCAGLAPMFPAADVLRVNFLGTRLFTELVVQNMSEGGAIVTTSSDGGAAWRKRLPLLTEFVAVESFEDGAAWYDERESEAGHAYAFGKEALNLWSMQQSSVLIKRGIRVNITTPGAVRTPMLDVIEKTYPPELAAATERPIGRASTPEEQVVPLLFLNSSMASYVNGADLVVDGGYGAMESAAGHFFNV
ncbi:coniferyl-alcohol dehydrogenase [Frondihabitans sp. VKM Ac-2883]|uniref:coniferyl-alcohol dehydrogenase n=1 Tax=Frondihabitans sp. VKM Ac-2883 TaxID=2783823 RepID=UPI00188B4EE5|nr:coniferyl-alcohol dehydrogenase [Frondihabitans sp. VKM Ac-2883]MBF4575499.1 coniferyl-alcohol dehydrogenase [Frondihabitans sp. VKM Ac-2883]